VKKLRHVTENSRCTNTGRKRERRETSDHRREEELPDTTQSTIHFKYKQKICRMNVTEMMYDVS